MDKIKDNIYKMLFSTAAEALLVVNSKGAIIAANPRASEMFGYSEAEFKTLLLEELIPQEYRHQHTAHRNRYHNDPKKRPMGLGMDLKACRKNGEIFPVEISLNYYKIEQETYVMALITDITERRAAQEKILKLNQELEQRVEERTAELRKSQQLYSAIARNFPNGTINVFDKDLKYIFVEGKELFKIGITGDMLIGTKFTSRLEPETAANIEKELMEVFEGKNKTLELFYKNNYYILNATPLYNEEDGKIDSILVVEDNVTEEKIAKQEILKSLEKEKELNELKSRFVSMASHEFRTPLSTILTSATLIEKYHQKHEIEKANKHIQRIKTNVGYLNSVLNDFLSLDKLEAGKISNNPQETDLKLLCEELVEEMQITAKTGQFIKFIYQGNTHCKIDRNIIRNILYNLLSNALKYSSENTEVIFETECNMHTLRFIITDKGIGIPEQEQVYLFDRFFRAHNATHIQGTGLGLNIVKKYLDLVNGEINFSSKLNEGTTFTVKINLTK
jgi:PAS domain S-box-containing protein